MHRIGMVGCLVFCTVSFALPARGAGTAAPPVSVLDGVKELEKRVTYTETKISLGELVQKVAGETGVNLTAGTGVADEPVAVVVKELPARELLVELAELLDYRWSRRGREGAWRYEIWQDVASRQREEALRAAAREAVENDLREQVARYAAMATLAQSEIERLYLEQEERERWREKHLTPNEQRAVNRSPEEKARHEKAYAALELWSPVVRAEARLLGRLSREQWSVLSKQGQLVFASFPRLSERLLPPDVGNLLRSAPPKIPPRSDAEGRLHLSDGGDEQRELEKLWRTATGFRIVIDLSSDEERDEDMVLSARYQPMRGAIELYPPMGWDSEAITLYLHAELRAVRQPSPERRRERQAALASDPVVGVQKIVMSTAPDAATSSGYDLWQLLPDLARAFEVQFIADAYRGVSQDRRSVALQRPMPLSRLLDMLAPDQTWDRRGRLIRLRSQEWYFRRLEEVPLRLVRRWKQMAASGAPFPFEEYLRMVGELSDRQLKSADKILKEMEVPLQPRISWDAPIGPDWVIYPMRRPLRLYASLLPEQRRRLWEGEALPVAQMTPRQRSLFQHECAGSRGFGGTTPNSAEIAAGAFALVTLKLTREEEPRIATGVGFRLRVGRGRTAYEIRTLLLIVQAS